METSKIFELQQHFDTLAHHIQGEPALEYWTARELQPHFGYSKWENFESAIEKAMTSCQNAGGTVSDHFLRFEESRTTGKGASLSICNYKLTRYACYLIAQNGDPRKSEIAFAQSYFAVQTRRTEIISERIAFIERSTARNQLRAAERELSQNIYERGVDDAGFGRIRSKGDQALFGGNTTADMKAKFNVAQHRPLADFLPTVTIAAKNLATEMTNYNVKQNDLHGEQPITKEHIHNNASVRKMLTDRGIYPENLPAEEDFAKQERRAKADARKIQASRLTQATETVSLPNQTSLQLPHPDDEKLLRFLAAHPAASYKDVKQALDISPATFYRRTAALQKIGILERCGSARKGTWKVSFP